MSYPGAQQTDYSVDEFCRSWGLVDEMRAVDKQRYAE